jgi:hypothetical protein
MTPVDLEADSPSFEDDISAVESEFVISLQYNLWGLRFNVCIIHSGIANLMTGSSAATEDENKREDIVNVMAGLSGVAEDKNKREDIVTSAREGCRVM